MIFGYLSTDDSTATDLLSPQCVDLLDVLREQENFKSQLHKQRQPYRSIRHSLISRAIATATATATAKLVPATATGSTLDTSGDTALLDFDALVDDGSNEMSALTTPPSNDNDACMDDYPELPFPLFCADTGEYLPELTQSQPQDSWMQQQKQSSVGHLETAAKLKRQRQTPDHLETAAKLKKQYQTSSPILSIGVSPSMSPIAIRRRVDFCRPPHAKRVRLFKTKVEDFMAVV